MRLQALTLLGLLVAGCASGRSSGPSQSLCASSAECSDGKVCVAGLCAPQCEDEFDCDTGTVCRQGACISPDVDLPDVPGDGDGDDDGGDGDGDGDGAGQGGGHGGDGGGKEGEGEAIDTGEGEGEGDGGGKGEGEGELPDEGGEKGEGEGEGEGEEDPGAGEGEVGGGEDGGEGEGEGEEGEGEGEEGEGEGEEGEGEEGEGEEGEGEEGEGEGPDECTRDGDCGRGQACLWRVDPEADDGLGLLCGPPVGGGAGGAQCEEDDFCRGDRCLVEAAVGCFRACVDHDDCGALQDCVEVDSPLEVGGGEQVTVNTCIDDPGSGEICEDDEGCPSNDEVCLPDLSGQAPELRCHRVQDEGSPSGGPCEDSDDCRNGICLDGRFCFAACGDAGDCPVNSPICELVTLRLAGEEAFEVRMCHPAAIVCETDVDCTPAEACGPAPNPARPGELRLICGGAVGPGLAGAECEEHQECRSGLCLEGDEDHPSVCWGPCQQNGDCEGNTMCYSPLVWFDIADRGPGAANPDGPPQWDSTSGCSPDIGSYEPCAHNAGCPAFEVCMPIPDRHRRAWDGVCFNARGNPFGQPGAACFNNEGCASGICLGQLPNTVCFGLCEDDGDCGDRSCVTRDIPVDNRGTPDDNADDIAAPMSHCFL